MKRILCLLLVLLTLFSLAGCGFLAAMEEAQSSSVDLQIVTRAPDTKPAEASRPTANAPVTEVPEPETQPAEPVPTENPTEPVPTDNPAEPVPTDNPAEPGLNVTEDGIYDSKEEVALYIHLYHHLPSNYITKKEAEKLGWPGGELEPYAPGKCIGGSHFGNYEGQLPQAKGRTWTECDIDTLGAKKRGAKRIIFSNDGLIYYTGDHYEHFELLYDGWED